MDSPARGAHWRECYPLSSRDSRVLLWPWGSSGGRPVVWARGDQTPLYNPPTPSAQSRSHSGGKDQPAASTPAPAAELEQHSQLLSPVDSRSSRALIRGDEAGMSLVLSAILPIGNTYWAARVISLTLRGLLTFAWDWSCCELCSHHCYMEFGFQHLAGPSCPHHSCW